MKRRVLLLGTVSALGALAGCGNPPSGGGTTSGTTGTSSAPAAKGTIGLSVMTLTNPFFKVIADTFTTEAKKQGYDVVTVSGEFEVAKQQDQVKDFIVRKVSAIVLTPCNAKSIGTAIKEANEAGIPVFTADTGSLDPDAKVVCHVATDNYGGGKEAGKAIIEALGESGGKIAILDFPQAESCILRVKGFKEVVDAYNKGRTSGKIETVAQLDGGGAKDKGYKSTEDMLQAHSDLAAIFAINDPSALGARAALEKAGKADQVKLIGFDGQPEGKQAIKDGKIYADPIQFPEQIASKTMDAIVKHFEGEKLPPQILIPTALYRKADGEKDSSLK